MRPLAAHAAEIVVAADPRHSKWLAPFACLPLRAYAPRIEGMPTPATDDGRFELQRPEWPATAAAAWSSEPTALAFLEHVVAAYDRLAPTTVFLGARQLAEDPDLPIRLSRLDPGLGWEQLSGELSVLSTKELPTPERAELQQAWRRLFADDLPELVADRAAPAFAIDRAMLRALPRSYYQQALARLLDGAESAATFRRGWEHLRRRTLHEAGLVTAVEATSFAAFQRLCGEVAATNRWFLYAWDCGLHDEQRAWCMGQPRLRLRTPLGKTRHAPLLLWDAPFDQAVWISPGHGLPRHPEQVFSALHQGVVLGADPRATGSNGFAGFRMSRDHHAILDWAADPSADLASLATALPRFGYAACTTVPTDRPADEFLALTAPPELGRVRMPLADGNVVRSPPAAVPVDVVVPCHNYAR